MSRGLVVMSEPTNSCIHRGIRLGNHASASFEPIVTKWSAKSTYQLYKGSDKLIELERHREFGLISATEKKPCFYNRCLHQIFVAQHLHPHCALHLRPGVMKQVPSDRKGPTQTVGIGMQRASLNSSYGIIDPGYHVGISWVYKISIPVVVFVRALYRHRVFVVFSVARKFQHRCTEVDGEDISGASAK